MRSTVDNSFRVRLFYFFYPKFNNRSEREILFTIRLLHKDIFLVDLTHLMTIKSLKIN